MAKKKTVFYYFQECVALRVGFHNSCVLTSGKEFFNIYRGVWTATERTQPL